MSFLEALILGIVQGLTEFLPISSSGHLVLVPHLLGWGQPTPAFDTVLHLGTLFAVVIYFRKELQEIISAFFQKGSEAASNRHLGLMIILGTIPAVIAGLLLEDWFEGFFANPSEVAGFLLLTGLLLIVSGTLIETSEKASRPNRGIDQLKAKDSLLIGLMQAAAIAPGISRSGATISMGLFLRFGRSTAARYSFLLSIPVIAGAVLFNLRHGIDATGESFSVLAVGFMASAVSGFAAVKFLLGFIKKHSLTVFAYYCFALGGAVIILYMIQ